jgi:hypothetical protein
MRRRKTDRCAPVPRCPRARVVSERVGNASLISMVDRELIPQRSDTVHHRLNPQPPDHKCSVTGRALLEICPPTLFPSPRIQHDICNLFCQPHNGRRTTLCAQSLFAASREVKWANTQMVFLLSIGDSWNDDPAECTAASARKM